MPNMIITSCTNNNNNDDDTDTFNFFFVMEFLSMN